MYMCFNCCCASDTRTNTTASIPHLQALEETVTTTSQPAQATPCKGLREEQAHPRRQLMCCAHDSVPPEFHQHSNERPTYNDNNPAPEQLCMYVCMYVKTNKKTQTAGQRSFSHNDAKPSTSKLHDVPRKRETNTLKTVN